MKKIGFIDYYLDEWHANNYPAWIELACEKLGVSAEIAYVWAEDPAPEGKMTTAEWCVRADRFAHRRQNHRNLVPGDEHPAL